MVELLEDLEQAGRWKIDVRFNKDTLRERLERIAAERDRIFITGIDGIEFLDSIDPSIIVLLHRSSIL